MSGAMILRFHFGHLDVNHNFWFYGNSHLCVAGGNGKLHDNKYLAYDIYASQVTSTA